MSDKIKVFDYVKQEVIEVEKVDKTLEQWQEQLTAEQFRVTRKQGTERAFTCELKADKSKGLFKCICCSNDLFVSDNKFDSGTGWPSFFEPVSELNIILRKDNSLSMKRIEVLCARCNAHLGHVFDDGPAPTFKRYCINGVALKFVPLE